MFILLKANNVDYSNKIKEGSYKVYKENVTHNWEDGNHTMHHDIIRTRTSGSFEVEFKRWSDFTSFLTNINAAKTGDYYALTVYALNTNESVTGNFFMKLPVELHEKADLTFSPGAFTISIEEA